MNSFERYVLWNYMLAEQCLLTDSYQGAVLLTVTPRILASALSEAGEGIRSPEEAEADFTAAVAAVYRDRVLSSPDKLGALKSTDTREIPLGVGFLALSVLAAYHMHTDDDRTGRAYHPRLAQMLGCELIRSIPDGFDGDAFVGLWEELSVWLRSHSGRRLTLPDGGSARRFVAYPLAHVPLRQVDIERLPQFFDAHGYEPGARAPLDRLEFDLCDGSGPWRYLTEAGQGALRDAGRRPFVIRQVAQELEHWDGCRTDSSGRRIATIELWMDIRLRRAQLSLVARRPPGFPDVVEHEDLVFESSQDGWYEPLPIGPDDGALLDQGLRASTQLSGSRYVLQFRPSVAIPLTPSDQYAGLVSDRVLRGETQCAVLCADSVSGKVASFLEMLCERRVHPRRDDTLPRGWCLFTEVRPSAIVVPPSDLERLSVESSVALVPEGGLRLGRRWTWLEGAPARVKVIGAHEGLLVRVDEQDVALESSGTIPSSLMRGVGTHVIELGNQIRQRALVVAGIVHPECKSWEYDPAHSGHPALIVPQGHWEVLGANAGEREDVFAPAEGALVRPDFRSHWAVRVGAGPGATALHLHDGGSSGAGPIVKQSTPAIRSRAQGMLAQAWASTIYQAHIRRPRLLCASGCEPQHLGPAWRGLAQSASALRRQLKRRQR